MQPYVRLPNSRMEQRFAYSASIVPPPYFPPLRRIQKRDFLRNFKAFTTFLVLRPTLTRSQKAREVLICDDLATHTQVFVGRDYALPALTAPYDGPLKVMTLINERTDVVATKAS